MLSMIGPHMVIQPVDRDTGHLAPQMQLSLSITLAYVIAFCEDMGWDFEIVGVKR